MTKEVRRLSIVILVMFMVLLASTTWIQAIAADNLAEHPQNKRTLYDSYEVQRGDIILADGTVIASSVPSDDVFSFQRVYQNPEMWAPVTGYLNPVIQSSTGIEAAANDYLTGQSDSQFFARIERLLSGQPPRGSSVQLSLDPVAQQAAWDALQGYQGSVIVMEPKTGRILAMVSTPSYDTNLLASHDSAAVEEAYQQLLDAEGDPLFNRAIAGNLNPPGSTFKVVVAAAALESGKYTANSALPNPAQYQLPQSTNIVTNASGGTCGPGETVTIADALRLSCNIPFAELAVELGDATIREQAEKFGWNESFETPLTSTPSFYPPTLDDARTALSGFGQGDVTATPLQIVMMSAAIANDGVVMAPTMIDRVIAPDLAIEFETVASEVGRAVDKKNNETLVSMMTANVANGAAGGARIEGVTVAGKTGTAENDNRPYTLWFTGFAPAEDPEIAIAVVVEDGGGQGQTGSGDEIAAPIAKQVMEAVLNQ